MPEALDADRPPARAAAREHPHPGRRRNRAGHDPAGVRDAGANLFVAGTSDLRRTRTCRGRIGGLVQAARMSLERALELAERGRGTTHPNPVVGAVVVRDGEVVGEGWHERKGGPHAEVDALGAAGERARGATLYVTIEPCSHHGSTPPVRGGGPRGRRRACRRRLARPEPGRGRRARACSGRAASRSSWPTPSRRGRRTRPGAPGSPKSGPFVTYKVAVDARRPRHRARRALGQRRGVAAGSSTSCAQPRTRSRSGWARSGPTTRASTREAWTQPRQPRRLAFGRGPLPQGSELELLQRSPATRSSRRSPTEGVQSLLLEGGPTLAGVFFADDLVDKVLVFVAPMLAGEGPGARRGA